MFSVLLIVNLLQAKLLQKVRGWEHGEVGGSCVVHDALVDLEILVKSSTDRVGLTISSLAKPGFLK